MDVGHISPPLETTTDVEMHKARRETLELLQFYPHIHTVHLASFISVLKNKWQIDFHHDTCQRCSADRLASETGENGEKTPNRSHLKPQGMVLRVNHK